MNKIVTIRGTSGSGKSTIMHTVLHAYKAKVRQRDKKGAPEVYEVDIEARAPLFILGRYETQCGGCDAMTDYQHRVPELIAQFEGQGHVAFEGLLVSGAYGAIGEYLEQYGFRAVHAFLDTPLEVCQARINERRARSNKPPLLDQKNTEAKFKAVLSVKRKLKEMGSKVQVVELNHFHAVRDFLRLFGVEKNITEVKRFGHESNSIRKFF